MEMRGFSRETHDRTRKLAHDIVLDGHSSSGGIVGLQGWALPVLSPGGQSSVGMLFQILAFQACCCGHL